MALVPAQTNAPATGSLQLEDLRDIKPPVPLGGRFLPQLALATALALAVLIAVLLLRRRRRRPPPLASVVPPHIHARQQLSAALDLIHDPEPFCTRVSSILRVYLERRFELRAPERTTEEFLSELRSSMHLTGDQKLALADFLTRCDLVKFARDEPAESELRQLWDVAMTVVEETSPLAVEGRAADPNSSGAAQPSPAIVENASTPTSRPSKQDL